MGIPTIPRHRAAFTLIELVVVIVIVGVVGAAALASIGRARQNRQRTAARTLYTDIEYIRERAMCSGRPSWAYVNTSTETATYWETVGGSVVPITNPATNVQLSTVLGPNSDGDQFADVAIGSVNGATSASPYIFGFDWQGRPTDSGGSLLTSAWTITVTQPGQGTITLTLSAETGLMSIAW